MSQPELLCRISWLFAMVAHFHDDYRQSSTELYLWAEAKLAAHLALQSFLPKGSRQ